MSVPPRKRSKWRMCVTNNKQFSSIVKCDKIVIKTKKVNILYGHFFSFNLNWSAKKDTEKYLKENFKLRLKKNYTLYAMFDLMFSSSLTMEFWSWLLHFCSFSFRLSNKYIYIGCAVWQKEKRKNRLVWAISGALNIHSFKTTVSWKNEEKKLSSRFEILCVIAEIHLSFVHLSLECRAWIEQNKKTWNTFWFLQFLQNKANDNRKINSWECYFVSDSGNFDKFT